MIPLQRTLKAWELKQRNDMGIHVETIFRDQTWEAILKHINKPNQYNTWYLTTPTNYTLFTKIWNPALTRTEYEQKLKTRYTKLKEMGENLQYHIHLTRDPNAMTPPTQIQTFDNGLEWLNQLGIYPKKVAFGWWKASPTMKEYAKLRKMHITNRWDQHYCHDYDLPL